MQSLESVERIVSEGQSLIEGQTPNRTSRKSAYRKQIDLSLPAPFFAVDVDCYVWPDGRSYTGQPSVEIHLVGCVPIMQAVLAELCQGNIDCRLAEPGEFTMRAFLAGRLDLPQCEAVLGVIHAESTSEFGTALKQLSGGIDLPVQSIRTALIEILADLEAGLDFVDDDIEFISQPDLIARTTQAASALVQLRSQLDQRSLSDGLPRIVLTGLPNAGKSSLINRLASRDVALVSDIAGTTRDYVHAIVDLQDQQILMCDTAGVEAAEPNLPMAHAQELAAERLEQAHLRLWCIDVTQSPDIIRTELARAGRSPDRIPHWVVFTKSDLNPAWRPPSVVSPSVVSPLEVSPLEVSPLEVSRAVISGAVVSGVEIPLQSSLVSVNDSSSIDALKSALSDWLEQSTGSRTDILASTSIRCRAAIDDAQTALERARETAELGLGDELTAAELRIALDGLGTVAGEVHNEEVLDALFSRFCIGK
jgi:tRNA modification GTPase